MIDRFISKQLRNLSDYANKNNFEFPKYRYSKENNMYIVQDYCYKEQDKLALIKGLINEI